MKKQIANCPKCETKIDFLNAYFESKYKYIIDENGKGYFEPHYEITLPHSFECPECQEELFKHESEAFEFLKGE